MLNIVSDVEAFLIGAVKAGLRSLSMVDNISTCSPPHTPPEQCSHRFKVLNCLSS